MFSDLIRIGLMATVGDSANAGGGDAAAGAGAGAPMAGGWITIIIYIVLFVALGYFLMYRPNKKKEKQKKAMLDGMKKGDKLTTIGGIQGRIAQIKDESLVIEVANLGSAEKVKIEIQKWAIGSIESSDDSAD